MQKFCRIALAISIAFSSSAFASQENTSDVLPILEPESPHATASKRITAQFTRAHYKQVKIDDLLFSF